jgi:hypothetical protein
MVGKTYRFAPIGGSEQYRQGAGELVTQVRWCSPPLRDHWSMEFPDGTIRPICTRDILSLG